MNKPIISVVMPVFNEEKFIAAAIKSILDQTFKDFEFLIIDDGSTDKTAEIVENFKAQDKRIILVKKKKSGLIACLKEGISLSRGNFIARMDADDIAFPYRLSKQFDYLLKNSNIDLVG